MTGALLLRNWQAIVGGVAVAVLGLLLMLAKADARHWHKQYDAADAWRSNVRTITSRAANIHNAKGRAALLRLDQVPIQIAYLGTTVDRLSTALAAKDEETVRRGEQLAAARAEDAQNRADAARRFAGAARSIDRLKAIAAAPDQGRCPVDHKLLTELEGL